MPYGLLVPVMLIKYCKKAGKAYLAKDGATAGILELGTGNWEDEDAGFSAIGSAGWILGGGIR